MSFLAEHMRNLIQIAENLSNFPTPPKKSMRERDFDQEWFKEQYPHVKNYHFNQSQDRMSVIFNIDNAADTVLRALGDRPSRKSTGQHPTAPLQQVLSALNLKQDQDHSGYSSGHSEHAHWWYHLENVKAGFGLFYMSRTGRVFEPDVWMIGAHDIKTLGMVTQLFRDAGIFPDTAEITLRRKEKQDQRLTQQLPGMGLTPGMIHSEPGNEFEILGTTPTGMVKVKYLSNHWKYPAGTVINIRPTQIKQSKLHVPGQITPAEAKRHQKIKSLNIKPGTQVSVKQVIWPTNNIEESLWEILEVTPDGMLKILGLKGKSPMGFWPKKSKGGFIGAKSGDIVDPTELTKAMIVNDTLNSTD